jgi:flagellar assembly protein FliH
LYSAGDNERVAHEGQGLDGYHFPNLLADLKEKNAIDTSEENEFESCFDGNGELPKFRALFENAKEASIALDEDEKKMFDMQMKQIREETYAKGFAEGRKAGEKGYEESLAKAIEALQDAVLKMDAVKTELYRDAERHAIKLALTIARKIVLREVCIDEGMILRVLGEALKKAGDHKEVHVKMNRADLQNIKGAGIDIEGLINGDRDVYFEPGDGLRKGECVVETPFGDIDARIESQLQTIEESLRQIFQDGSMAM